MSAIQQLKQDLCEKGIRFEEYDTSLAVKAQRVDGFDIVVTEGHGETTVFYEGWHEHFTSEEEAVKCFLFGLTSKCRIRVTERGGKPHKWTLEAQEDGKWVSYGSTGLLFFPFWRRPITKYLQNAAGT